VVNLTRVLTAFGVSFGLGAADPAVLAAAVERVRALGWRDSIAGDVTIDYWLGTPQESAPRNCFELRCQGVPISCADNLEDLLEAFSNQAKLQTACQAKGVLFVDAGVIGWHGRGLVMPGRSGAGKTTLVSALLGAGADYYSDEFAVLDADALAHAYSVPLSIRGRGTRRERRSAEEIGGRVGTTPISVDLIVIAEYIVKKPHPPPRMPKPPMPSHPKGR
jgi:hypothetical protein